MPVAVEDRFTEIAAAALREAIRDAGGNEVYCLATLDAEARVETVRVLARGNQNAVPALLQIPRPGEVVIHNHPSGRLQPSDADIGVASALGNNGVGSYLTNNSVTELYVIAEPHRAKTPSHIDASGTAAMLDQDGVVAQRLAGYEHRPQQLRMLAAVAEAFNDEAMLTVEAGTGTGKSLAYLLPALTWSLQNKERVVVSTHTINLQEQLIAKDLPFLVKQAGLACTAVLVKGRGNYLCQRKAAQLEDQPLELVADESGQELKELLAWAKRTKDGSLSDLAVRPRMEVWDQVISESDNCTRVRCEYYDDCFFYSARRAAAQADIIVVNHHLLMADLALREQSGNYTQNAVLPPVRGVIVDEAHHLAEVATNFFSARLTFQALERNFGRLRNKYDSNKGLLFALLSNLRSLRGGIDAVAAAGAADLIQPYLLNRWHDVGADAEQIFNELLFGFQAAIGRDIAPGAELKQRIVPSFAATVFWQTLCVELSRLSKTLESFAGELGGVIERVEAMEQPESQLVHLSTELKAVQGRLLGFAVGLGAFVTGDDSSCRWIEGYERGRRGAAIAFCSAPISVAPMLRKALFEQFPTVVMTSATLAVDRRFDYLHHEVGLDQFEASERVQTLQVDSPFDFAGQAILAVPKDIPDPNESGYEPATHAVIRDVIDAAKGGVFVLFTAYGALRRAIDALGVELNARGYTVLQQGTLNRHHLLERFVSAQRAVLFATDSFWEGVDVRGEALRCVIITRLPFRVPSEPIEEARVEAIQARGGNPFNEHSIPQAVLKLKQGFGRLIRSKTDRGAVVLLDSRVVRKNYGRVFLDSLPPARRLIADRATVIATLRRFYGSRQS